MMQQQQQQQQQQQMTMPGGAVEFGQVNQRFKTQKCRHFENKGFCQWNENCQYAHGDAELRDINDPIPEHLRGQASRRVVPNNRNINNQSMQGGGNQGGDGNFNNNNGSGGGNSRGGPYQSRGGYGRGGYHSNGSGGYGGRGGHNGNTQGGYQPYGGGQGFYQMRGGNRGGMGQGRGGSNMGGSGGMFDGGDADGFQGVRRQGRGGGRGGYQGSQGGHQQNGGGGPGQGFKNHKTVMCKHYNAGKNCPYQNNCTYAHGLHELRQPMQNNHMGNNNQGGMYQNKAQQQQQFISPQQMAMQAYPQPMYGGLIQQVGIPGQMQFEPTIIYGEPNGPQQRYDYGQNQGQFDQQAVQQQMLVNNQANPAGMPMYMAAAGVQQPGGIMTTMQQPMVPSTQIVINSTQDGPDGQPIQTQRLLTIFILHNTQEVQDQLKMVTDLRDQGNYEQALRILSQLGEAQKISMQEQTMQQNFGDPQDLSFIQQQQQQQQPQQPQNEAQQNQETPGLQ